MRRSVDGGDCLLQTLRKGEGCVRNGQRALFNSEELTAERIPWR